MPGPDAKRHRTAVDNPTEPTGYQYAELDGEARVEDAALAEECALAISYNGISYAVMMVSPSALEDFVAGFSLSSAAVQSIDDIYDIRIEGEGIALHAEVDIGNRAFWSLKQQRRNLARTTGCGLCGVEALEQGGDGGGRHQPSIERRRRDDALPRQQPGHGSPSRPP